MRAILAVNMKAYESAFGSSAIELAREASRLSSRLNSVRVILAAPALVASKLTSIYEDIYVQHVDAVSLGAYTGFLPIRALKIENIKGTILNHSEHKLTYREIQRVTLEARELGLETLLCADMPEEAASMAILKPTMIAVEPPELIGTGVAVSRAKPEVITMSVGAVKTIDSTIPVLAGAGISSPEDAVRAIELGASGVLVASAIMKTARPAEKLREFAEALASLRLAP